MKDAKGHGSNPRGGPTSPRAERTKLNRQLDQRKTEPPATRPWGPGRPEYASPVMKALQSQFGNRAPSAERVREIVAQQTMATGAHTSGVHNATVGANLNLSLAEVSAKSAVPQSQAKVGGNS